mgnify:FL=1
MRKRFFCKALGISVALAMVISAVPVGSVFASTKDKTHIVAIKEEKSEIKKVEDVVSLAVDDKPSRTKTVLKEDANWKTYDAWLKNVVSVTKNGKAVKFSYEDYSYAGLDESEILMETTYEAGAEYVIKAKGYYNFVWKDKRIESDEFTPVEEEKPEEDVADKKPVGPYHTLAESDEKNPFIQLVRDSKWEDDAAWMKKIKKVLVNGKEVKFKPHEYFDDDLPESGFRYLDIEGVKAKDVRSIVVQSTTHEDFVQLFTEKGVLGGSVVLPKDAVADVTKVHLENKKFDKKYTSVKKWGFANLALLDENNKEVVPSKEITVFIHNAVDKKNVPNMLYGIDAKDQAMGLRFISDGEWISLKTKSLVPYVFTYGYLSSEESGLKVEKPTPKQTEPKTETPVLLKEMLKKIVSLKKVGKLKIKVKKHVAKVSWKKVNGAKGYVVAYKTKKAKKWKHKSLSGNSLKIKKLKAGKYAFKVRAYIDLGKSKTYGKWSKVNKTKVK